jgi:hypothetical protein
MRELHHEVDPQCDALLLGRMTYKIFAAYWPHVPNDDPIGQVLNLGSSTNTVAQATSGTARSWWTTEAGSRRSGPKGRSADE